jgi:hypothetical protein
MIVHRERDVAHRDEHLAHREQEISAVVSRKDQTRGGDEEGG